jgi:hypothetical protein
MADANRVGNCQCQQIMIVVIGTQMHHVRLLD